MVLSSGASRFAPGSVELEIVISFSWKCNAESIRNIMKINIKRDFNALHKIVFVSCGNLHGDTASAACHYRFSFPECFCHDQTETFANGFLQNHSSAALEDIDLHTPHTSHIREQIEIWILDGFKIDLVQYFPALGIVPCHGTHHRKLNIRNFLLSEPIRADNSERIFPGIEARDLKQQWPAHINAHLCDGAATDLRRQIHVLGGQRIDGGRNEYNPIQFEIAGPKSLHREYCCIVLLDVRTQEFPDFTIGRGTINMAAPNPFALMLPILEVSQCGWLGVMDNDDIVVFLQHLRADLVVFKICLLRF